MLTEASSTKTAALLCAVFMLAPVSSAVAWTHVCVDMPFGQVSFTGVAWNPNCEFTHEAW